MKSPKMPEPTKSVKPTAPQSSTSGAIEATERQKRKQGLFSTLLGQGTSTSNKLGNYLGMSSNSTANTSAPNRIKPGGATVA